MTAVLLQLCDTVEALEAVDAHRLPDAVLHDTVVALVELDSRLAAARAWLVAVWDARQVWADDGSRSAASRLSRECHVSSKTGKRELAHARGLASLPATSVALRDGKLSVDQADLVRWANQPDIAAVVAREEQFLIDLIVGLRLDDARRAIDYWIDRAYQEIGKDRPYRFRAGRHVQIGRTFQGTVNLKGRLDPLAGTEVMAELTRIERKLFEQDWAAARAEHGPHTLPSHLPRTTAQRMADTLQEMARNSAGFRAGVHHQPRPLISILTGFGAFTRMCELSDGTVISPEHVVPYLLEGDIERIVFDSPSRVIDVGVRERFFTGALRRAIQVRDRRCQHASGCDVPAEDCDIDHIIEYAKGGLTTQDNGRCHCHKHNLRRNNHPDRPPDPDNPPDIDDTS